MMKRLLVLCLALLCLLFSIPAQSAEQPALYTGQVTRDSQIYTEPSFESATLGYVPKGNYVDLLELEPAWVKVRTKKQVVGYIRRHFIIDASVKTVNPTTTPPYSAVECGFLAWVAAEAPILAEPRADAQVLITMRAGARLALMDMENGWARLIYHRQYAYINTNQLSEILPINQGAAPGSDAPIAAYTSFYRITTDQSNLNRMVNLQVANDRFTLYTLAKGDRLDFNKQIGPYSRKVGYLPANALVDGETVQGYGGGTCQVSSTLYNVVLQLPGVDVLRRRPHGPNAAPYLPHGADAAVGTNELNLVIQNQYDFPIRIDGTTQDGALTIAIYRAD